MTSVTRDDKSAAPSGRRRPHWAWAVAGVSLLVLISSSGFRALPGVTMDPMHDHEGWSHSEISFAVSVNLVIFALTAPFAAALMMRYGIGRTVAASLALIAVGSGLPARAASAWQLTVYWGLLVGLGSGALAVAFVTTLTQRWFHRRRGLVTGVLTAGGTAGQLVFLPLLAWLVEATGWRAASLVVAAAALATAPLALWLIRDDPRELGLRPYGADDLSSDELSAMTADELGAEPSGALRALAQAARTSTFWLLAGGFAICGVTTAGMIQTHFVPAAGDHGMPGTTAAGLLALAGVFDIVGTTLSGFLTDRVDSRVLLGAFYTLRGISLFFLPSLFSDSPTPSLLVFTVFYGLDWIATVPPMIRLCQDHFGADAAIVFGWMWTAHQLGGAAAAAAGGVIRDYLGAYTIAWYGSAVLCLLAAASSLAIRTRQQTSTSAATARSADRGMTGSAPAIRRSPSGAGTGAGRGKLCRSLRRGFRGSG
ncbi:MFS transporter [Actinomadura gamaensis]|uniref:MFS transporter n=1 Tax=Actinomadura gamaensis TaxID=1763541 RepID=A0ABV9TZ36_9ACTN